MTRTGQGRRRRIALLATLALAATSLVGLAMVTGVFEPDADVGQRVLQPTPPPAEHGSERRDVPAAVPSAPVPLLPSPDTSALAAQPALRLIGAPGWAVRETFCYQGVAFPESWLEHKPPGFVALPDPADWASDPLRCRISMPGHRSQVVQIPSDARWPLDVALTPLTTLEVVLEMPPSGPHPTVRTLLAGEGELREPAEWRHDWMYPGYAQEPGDVRTLPDFASAIRFCGVDGRLLLVGVRPEHPLTVIAQGVHGERLASEEVVLTSGEHRIVTLAITEVARSLRGHVFDEAGRPLQGVTVTLWPSNAPPGASGSAHTDAEGHYAFTDIACRDVKLFASRRGHSPMSFSGRHERDLDLDGTTSHAFVLSTPPPFLLSVRQAGSGRPAKCAVVEDVWGPWTFRWMPSDTSAYRPRSLPARDVTIRVRHRGHEYFADYHPGDTWATCLVPECADVLVRGILSVPGQARAGIRVSRLHDGELIADATNVSTDTYLVRELPPGSYEITQRLPDGEPEDWQVVAACHVVVTGGQSIEVTLRPVDR